MEMEVAAEVEGKPETGRADGGTQMVRPCSFAACFWTSLSFRFVPAVPDIA